MSQPIWECIGHIGDVDPIAYGGGFIYTGLPVEELQTMAASDKPETKAALYECLIKYFGAGEFDSYPNTFTEGSAYQKYELEMRLWQVRNKR
jgi:hypothetical protein